MAVESRPFVAMQNKEKEITAQISAFGTLSGAVGAFQGTVTALADSSKYKVANASSSDATVLTATTGKDTVKGNYSVKVDQLAQAQTISAAGQASTTALIGSGASTVLTFDFGSISGGTLANGSYTGATFNLDSTRVARTVTIDGSNNSLQGIRDAINKAAIGVTASIISDGSDKPNRLVLTSDKSGETSSMRVSVAGDQDISNLLAYAPNGTQNMAQSNAGQNAKLTVNGVAITSQTNNVDNAVPGVTMTIIKAGNSSVGVRMDTSGINTALSNFVKAYNELNTTVNGLTAVTPDLKKGAARTGGPLIGDSTTNSLQASLRKLFGSSVPGLDGSVTSLSQLGVAFQKDGTLKLDTGKLQTAIDKNSDDVIKLLATSGSTSDSLVSFVSSTSNSTVGTKGISISRLATQGTLVGSTAANLTITAGVNDNLSLTINGVSTKATLVPGSYTADSLVSHVQSLINGASGVTDATAGVKVTQQNGVFSIVSNKYGSSSKLEITGSGANDLFGTPTMTTGEDVTGTIDGAVAVGSGQTLTGSAGSGSAGIAVLINGGQLGDRGTVNISKGISALFATITDNYLGTAGLIQNKSTGLNKSIADIAKQRDALNTRLTLTEARLRRQYSSLDVTLSSMNSTSNFLTQQLAKLS
ncbi:hypothetical protein CD932_04305 [Janthinobacterium sp. PC23-8]|nr:hypothetical protein CD932_04305 [Janthinobacterium sp. PC23-8]